MRTRPRQTVSKVTIVSIRQLRLAARMGLLFLFMLAAAALAPQTGRAAPYAAMVMDARTGEVVSPEYANWTTHPNNPMARAAE